ncbi:SusC/RagA family TonB-linked outer membrane protein [Flavobacterium sp.]|uniref:SusC/RagA family TonB-linked outer membrane protein n=1 Tax=Flavobacterium sp. TaxID=239 RepID=UPI00391B87DC
MRSKFKWIFTLLLAFTMQFSFAQEKTVTGVVSDVTGPLPSANIIVKGTKNSTQTDFDGKFSIKAKQGDVLVISFTGYNSQSINVTAANTYNVTLSEGVSLTEVVIVSEGYNRARTKASTTSALTTVTAEVIENRPNASFLNSLQGTAPGASILSSSGSPGSGKIDLLIRGASSLNASTDPLIVIDGVPTNGNQFRSLNQNDIETVSILRDAAATSIYGNRGANGVLVITTKQGKYGSALKITYDVVNGVNVLPKNKYNMSNSRQALTIEKNKNTGLGATLTDAEIAAYSTNTNWTDEFFGVDVTQQHNLGLTFGGENITTYSSFGYFKQGGMVPTTDFQRFTFRNNLNGKSKNGKFTYNTQLSLAYSRRSELNQETNDGVNNNTIQNPLHGATMGLPYVEAGQYATGQDLYNAIGTDFSGPNDTYVLEDILKDNSLPSWADESAVLANISASYKLTNDLTLSNKFGIDFKQSDRVFARSPWSYLAIAVRESRAEEFGGFERISASKDFTFTNIASLGYSKKIKEKHRIDANVYMEYMKAHFRSSSQFQNGLNLLTYAPGAGTGYIAFNPATPNSYISTAAASKIDAGTLSYFATLDYDYNDKYGFAAVIRRDATYRFVDDYKWGTFWSVSGRWNVDKEKFMEGSIFSMLKLRASYGTQGNQNIVAPGYGTNPLLLATSIVRDLNATGAGYNNDPGIFVSNIANTDLRWEEISQANIGLDFIMLNNRIEGNVDVYRKQTEKLYSDINRSAATSIYSQSGNNGGLRNTGVELQLKYNVFKNKALDLQLFANMAYNKNEITSLTPTDQSGSALVNQVGDMAYQWNLIPYVGVNQANGNLLFLDADGNVTENPDLIADRRLTGKSSVPVYQGGFGFNATYKGFFFNTLFSWTKDVWRVDNQLSWAYNVDFIGDDNVSSDMLNAWTAQNPTNFPALNASNGSTYGSTATDRFLYDSSFLRFKNLTFGYNFPSNFLKGTFIQSLRLYAQAENLYTWTKWRGFDPENTQVLSVTAFPNPKTVSFGASIRF